MKILFSFLILFSTTLSSCQKKYGCDDLVLKHGYFYEKDSGQLANGQFDCSEDSDKNGIFHQTIRNYNNGREVGEWLSIINNDTLHHGKIVAVPEIEKTISQKYDAEYIKLEIWYEGDLSFFDLSIIEAKINLDSTQIQSMVNSDLKEFMIENNVNKVAIQSLNEKEEWTTFTLTE